MWILCCLTLNPCLAAAPEENTSFTQAVEAQWKRNFDEAIRLYSRVIDENPKNAQALFYRGVAFRSKGREDQALSDFEKAAALNPELVEAIYGKGLIYLHKKNYDKALQDMDLLRKVTIV